MLTTYRSTLHDVNSHQHDIAALRGQLEALPETNEKLETLLQEIIDRHAKLLSQSSEYFSFSSFRTWGTLGTYQIINNQQISVMFSLKTLNETPSLEILVIRNLRNH